MASGVTWLILYHWISGPMQELNWTRIKNYSGLLKRRSHIIMKHLMQAIPGSFCMQWSLSGKEKPLFMALMQSCIAMQMHFPKMRSGCSLHQTMTRILIVEVNMKEWDRQQEHLPCYVRHGMEFHLSIAGRNYRIHTDCGFL